MASDQLGRYRLLEPLAQGGMAEIFLARQEGPGGFEKTVVIKRMRQHLARDPEFMTMFMTEARVAARLSHPNIVQVYDFGELDGMYFLCMEWLVGGDLAQIMTRLEKRGQRMPPSVAGVILSAVCDALHYAHNLADNAGKLVGLVHRDLSPQNIYVTTQGAVKVLDFGIVKMAGRGIETRAGVIKGKAYYLSPEQVRGKPLDARSDLFALGAVLYELVTNVRPFQREEEFACLNAILEDPIPSPRTIDPSIPEPLEKVIMKALERDPAQRYQSAHAMRVALDAYVASCTSNPAIRQLQGFMADLWSAEPPPQPAAGPAPAGASSPSVVSPAPAAGSAAAPPSVPGTSAAVGKDTRISEAPPVDPEEMVATNARISAIPESSAPAAAAAADAAKAVSEQTGVREPSVVVSQDGETTVPRAVRAARRPVQSTGELIDGVHRASSRKWLWGVVAVIAGVGGFLVWRATATPEPAAASIPLAAAPQVVPVAVPPRPDPAPPPPPVEVAAKAEPVPTAKADPVPEPKPEPPPPVEHKKPLRPEAPKHPVVAVAPKPPRPSTGLTAPPPPVSAAYGKLDVNCVPWCQVWIDSSKAARNSPVLGLELAAGPHHLKVVQPESGAQQTRDVAVDANQVSRVIIRF